MKPFLLLILLAYQTSLFADEPFPIPYKGGKEGTDATESAENSRPRRKASRHVGFVGIGPAFLGNLNTNGAGYLLSGAYGWDLNEAIIKLSGDLAINGSAAWVNLGLGVQGFLFQGDHSPYLAGDFGIAYGRSQNPSLIPRTMTGFSLGVQVGVQLFRTSDVQFDVGFKYGVLLKTNPNGHPYVILFKVGIWF